MRTARPVKRPEGFSLIELLVVIAIIALLAAMLLPALDQAKGRAKSVQCKGDLRQVGLGFQSFAHDHNGHFPMAVPGEAGGSLEFTLAGYRISGNFYFGFRHFEVLSNELTTPRLLACPGDSRAPALSFAQFDNRNLSYWVGVLADFNHPASYLAGDRSLYCEEQTLLRLRPGDRFDRAASACPGNILFADGHVKSPAKIQVYYPEPPDMKEDLVQPTVEGTNVITASGSPTAGTAAGKGPGLSKPANISPPPGLNAGVNPGSQPTPQPKVPSPNQPKTDRGGMSQKGLAPPGVWVATPVIASIETSGSNLTSQSALNSKIARAPVVGSNQTEDPEFKAELAHIAAAVGNLMPGYLWLLYLLGILLLMAYLIRRRVAKRVRDRAISRGKSLEKEQNAVWFRSQP
jgi:prepilin-type N-terminal cleavage/methylation domain-containing protein/prepilin-type processing-associated H-X9-DG protein